MHLPLPSGTLALALLLAAAAAAPVPRKLDLFGARPKVDDVMRRVGETPFTPTAPYDAPDAPDALPPLTVALESGAGWVAVVPRGCRLFLCL